jgi:iron complex outermembrane receptor protein
MDWGEQIMRNAVVIVVALLVTGGIVAPARAQAASAHYELNIPRQSLDTALKDFAQQTGLQIARFSDTIDGDALVGPIQGNQTLEQGLRELLAPLGLNYKVINDTTIAIINPKAPPTTNMRFISGEGLSSGGDGQVEARVDTSKSTVGDSRGTLRLAQNTSANSSPSDAQIAPKNNNRTSSDVKASEEGEMNNKLEEIVVVARRREENLQSVPMTVTAISASVLERNTVQTGTDLQGFVPTLSVTQEATSANVGYSIRGVRSGVLTYFGDVPVDPDVTDLQLWDLSTVQALAGPQGTLFGRNSTGGAILFIPQKPTKDFEGYAEVTGGNHGYWQTSAVVNLPVSDTLQFRLGTQITRRDGIVENSLGPDLQSQHRDAYRLSALWTPTDAISNYTVFDYAERDEQPFPFVTRNMILAPCNPALGNLITCPFVYGSLPAQQFALQQQLGIRNVASPQPTLQQTRPWGVMDVLSGHFDGFDAKYIGSYRSDKSNQLANQTSLAIPVTIGDNDEPSNFTNTQELQLFGKSLHDSLDWIVGTFYLRNSNRNSAYYELLGPVGVPFSPAIAQGSGASSTLESIAAYMQGTYAITNQFKLTMGVRYTHDKPTSTSFSTAPAPTGSTCILPADAPGVNLTTCQLPLETTFHAITYNVSLDYQITPEFLVYVTTRRGYNTGGFNAAVPVAPTFQPEYITDYEIGMKSEWMVGNHPIRGNASTYLSKYRDIQRFTNFFEGNPPAAVVGTFNAAAATLYGAQAEVDVGLTNNLELAAYFAYLHSKYDSFDNVLIGDATGNRFAQAPEHTARASLTYHQPVSLGGEVRGTVSYAFQGAESFVDANLGMPNAFQGGYGLVDARLDWREVAHSHVDLGLFVKNLTNKVYAINILDETATPLAYASVAYGDPRTYGAQIRYRF